VSIARAPPGIHGTRPYGHAGHETDHLMHRLLHPRSVAVVGASDRPDTYSSETLLNLRRLGFEGAVWGVNPRRSSVHGFDCFPSLSELPGVPDAVVVAVPAPGVPAVVEEAGALGCGGAVVYGAGFGEAAGGVALEAALRDAAARWSLPVCGPNCDGLIALHSRAALWGDALAAPEPGHVALVSQSGNLVVNALATRRGLRLHTAISSGNEAVVTTPDWVEQLAREEGVRSIALLIEADGDGARLCEALAACADAGVAVAVLKVGSSAAGVAAAAAHTGAVAGDHRVFRALVEEAGAAWAADVHDLLELAKALATSSVRPRAGLAILTCSGGDSGLGADEAERVGVPLPSLAPVTVESLRSRLPAAATVANPLDYTAMIWGEVETLRDLIRTVAEDPAIGHVLVFYDRPPGIEGASLASWEAVEAGILAGAAAAPVPVMVAATLPELLDDESAWRFIEAGVPAIAGLRTGVAVAAALAAPLPDAARLRAISAACRPVGASRWLAEHEAKALLRARGLPVVAGRLALNEDEAETAFRELASPVALKVSSPDVQHKTAIGGIALDIRDEAGVREAFQRLSRAVSTRLSCTDNPTAASTLLNAGVLVETMAPPGAEIFVAVRTDAVVPVLVVGRGGVDVEALDDVAIVPLPADEERIERALATLKLPVPPGAASIAAQIAAAADGLALLECNPVLIHSDGAVVVDAIAKEVVT
jgi:acetate---CoA ligase (ADP-forming)